MCGHYGRRSDKQKIAEAFHVRANLDDIDFMPNDDITPGTMQPVPADRFFEWKRLHKKNNPKYAITVPGRQPFALAGIWSMWKNKEGDSLLTVSVITSEPNEKMSDVHDRQPVILEPRDYAEWLTTSDRPPVHLLRILPADEMKIELLEAHNMQLPLNSA